MTASLTIIRPKEFIVLAADSCEADGLGRQTGCGFDWCKRGVCTNG
jgi:hypothetical protein